VKKAKCITIDASLLAEAEEAAAKLGTTFSALVEEALRRFLSIRQERGVEERLTNIEALLRQCLQARPAEAPVAASAPPPLGDNLWVSILRRRG
jgi:Arc/MetJ family transcription regulator